MGIDKLKFEVDLTENPGAMEFDSEIFLSNIYKGFTLKCQKNAVERTPVLTGRLRGNWNPDINKTSRKKKYTRFDNTGRSIVKSINNTIASLPKSDLGPKKLTLTNNINEYVYMAEDTGWERTGPYNMVKETIADADRIFHDATTDIKTMKDSERYYDYALSAEIYYKPVVKPLSASKKSKK